MNGAQAIKLRRVRRGGILVILGVLLLSLWMCDPGRLALVSSATDMIRLARGPDGPVVFNTNDFGHELYGRDVALIRAHAVIGDPVISIGGVPIVIEDRLDLPIAVHSKAVWPWPDQRPTQVVESLREEIAGMMRIRTSSAGWLRPGWWQEPQRTILWRGVLLVVGRLAAWPLLVVGIVMLVYPSRTERRWARLSRGICPKCKYDLTGVQDRCPECGRELSADEAAALRARPRKDEGPR